MARLWEKMGRIYGHKWSSVAESDDGTWLDGLRGITPEEVAHGLSGCMGRDNDWPPDLPEFRKLCKPEHVVIEAMHRDYKVLPKPDADPEIAENSIKKMKGILKHGLGYLDVDPSAEQIEKVKETIKKRVPYE